MPQNYVNWPTYVDVLEQLSSAAIPVRSGVSNSYYTKIIDGVVDDLLRCTHRQFVADSSDVTRAYDGSGTGELDVDDMVSLSSVTMLPFSGSPEITFNYPELLSLYSFPKNKLIIYPGLPNMVYGGYIISRFPRGRANIRVTGRFGYAEYIPDAVWLAVRGMASAKVAAEFIADANTGRILQSFIEGSSSEKYASVGDGMVGSAYGWVQDYKQIKLDFRRPLLASGVNRRRSKGMI